MRGVLDDTLQFNKKNHKKNHEKLIFRGFKQTNKQVYLLTIIQTYYVLKKLDLFNYIRNINESISTYSRNVFPIGISRIISV